MDMRGFYKNHYVDFEDLYRRNGDINISLTGIVKRVNQLKNSIMLKLINFDNFIDTHKVYLNFKD